MQRPDQSLHGNLALQLEQASHDSRSQHEAVQPRREAEQPRREAEQPRRQSGRSIKKSSSARVAAALGRSAAPRRVADAQPARPVIETVRIAADPPSRTVSLVDERKRQIRRELTIRRIRDLVLILLTVVAISGIFGLMVWRQSRILADNFANLSIERQIKRLDESSSQISENLAVRTELSQIRSAAVQRLGLQVPARSQIVPVVIPNTDRVVFNDKLSAVPGDEAYLMGLIFNLEGFFKTLDVKGTKGP